MPDYQWELEVKGGPGSGHWGHAGRPGKRGGSLPGKGGSSGPASNDDSWGGEGGDLFGDWAVNLRTEQLMGYRGVNRSGVGFGSTEGKGTYISKDRELAQFFAGDRGRVKQVRFDEPKNPLIVDNEELYLLSESDALEDPPNKSDSPWLSANKEAVARMYKETGGKWDPDLAASRLTDILKSRGHDAVYVRSAGEEWVVLFGDRAKKEHGELEWSLEVIP